VGRMLVSQTPGGAHERFFEEVGEAGSPVFEDRTDVASIAAIAAKYGIEIPVPIAEETWPKSTTNGVQR